MNARDTLQNARLLTPEDRAQRLLEHLLDGVQFWFSPEMPGPVVVLRDGRRMQYPEWDEWDYCTDRGWIVVEGDSRVLVTWAGEKARRKYERKARRVG
jgi:hypothetical protein